MLGTAESVIQQAVELAQPLIEGAHHELGVDLPGESAERAAARMRLGVRSSRLR